MFGSARFKEDHAYYQLARTAGAAITRLGFTVMTGGGPGIMEAANRGAFDVGCKSIGLNIKLPAEQQPNPFITPELCFQFKYFALRKFHFILRAAAVVLFPGGFGTLDEGYEALTLMQTGKSQLMPLICMDKPGGTYWKTWDQNIKEHLLRNGLISTDDLCLYQYTDSPDQAVKWITRFYRNYHSSRYVRDLLVIRLKHPPTESALAALNEDFADIIAGEKIHLIKTTPEEQEDTDNIELPRIAFEFGIIQVPLRESRRACH